VGRGELTSRRWWRLGRGELPSSAVADRAQRPERPRRRWEMREKGKKKKKRRERGADM